MPPAAPAIGPGSPRLIPRLSLHWFLVCPQGFDPTALAAVSPRLLVLNSEEGPAAEMVRRNLADLPDAKMTTLSGYISPNTYADVAAERTEEIGSGILEFLEQRGGSTEAPPEALGIAATEGEAANISYQTIGSGPPLVLLPLGAAPTQWRALLPRLSRDYTVIVLGGAELGMVATLEARGRTPGYLGVLGNLMQEAQLQPGETILEVGCGTGVLDRWLARHTQGRNRIVGIDVNPFFLREAAALAEERRPGKRSRVSRGQRPGFTLPRRQLRHRHVQHGHTTSERRQNAGRDGSGCQAGRKGGGGRPRSRYAQMGEPSFGTGA